MGDAGSVSRALLFRWSHFDLLQANRDAGRLFLKLQPYRLDFLREMLQLVAQRMGSGGIYLQYQRRERTSSLFDLGYFTLNGGSTLDFAGQALLMR